MPTTDIEKAKVDTASQAGTCSPYMDSLAVGGHMDVDPLQPVRTGGEGPENVLDFRAAVVQNVHAPDTIQQTVRPAVV